ncbi:sugar-transfer associated ATP-grasp domain-containing protein [Maribacter sp. SA7]|uniref:sugar-transfer associated ATP-grasp domain-containing protein n=1 Tax=Maribacter zhoushanensis TaxID=3030012 RepID=UPI0023EA8DDC|nr:sugar-transfer associated ATP-grasp domain-containing protein [Maribacter zhoushanensis]MDF4201867.1 sugar-transfer associated ATP-grasp domain-containing protein [Maribacter zhoushanensis]
MMQFTKLTKQSFERALNIKYHYDSNKVAKRVLQQIELEKGKLNSKSKKVANDYARDVLGWKGFAPWLYVYTLMYGKFMEGWLPDNYYGRIVLPKIQGDYGKISFLKPFTNKVFNENICQDLAYYINGEWFSKDFKIKTSEQINALIANDHTYNNIKVINKLDHSYQGKGIRVYNKDSFNANKVSKNGNGVIQPFIDQHDFFNQFTKDAVATLRFTTVIDNDDKASLRASFIRLGRNNQTHVQSSNQIIVPIDATTGRLAEIGYDQTYKSTHIHPDTKVTFENKTIPFFHDCVNMVLDLQNKMPMIKLIGWDIIVDNTNRIVLMEWNGYGTGIAFSEATQGPGFSDLGWSEFYKK